MLCRALKVLLLHLAVLAVCLLLGGCQGFNGRAIVAEQKPGLASGAGASLTGPANSAAPSSQVATRRTRYYPPAGYAAAAPGVPTVPAVEGPEASAIAPAVPPLEPLPALVEERTETTLGAHQDAAGILKVATAIGSWGRGRWCGVLCLFIAYSGLLWAHNNPDGYPAVCWKIGGIGAFLALFDPSPWWLLLLVIPGAFYLLQKMGIVRIPAIS